MSTLHTNMILNLFSAQSQAEAYNCRPDLLCLVAADHLPFLSFFCFHQRVTM